MPDISITITNLPQIRRAFEQAPNLMRKELNQAIKRSIITIQRDSMLKTPVLTGRLRASTSSRFSDLRGEVGTHTNYDIYVHNGTRYMKGRPYLQDAVDKNQHEVIDIFKNSVQNVLDRIAKTT